MYESNRHRAVVTKVVPLMAAAYDLEGLRAVLDPLTPWWVVTAALQRHGLRLVNRPVEVNTSHGRSYEEDDWCVEKSAALELEVD